VKKDWKKYAFDVPLAVPHLAGKEWEYVKNCLDTNWITSAGAYIEEFEEKIANYTNAKYCVAVSSGTAALHLALQAVGVGANTCVILPNLSFVASANAVHYCNAKPIFIDIRKDTWQIDENLLEDFLEQQCYQEQGNSYLKSSKEKIAALLPVHCLGNMPNMNKLLAISRKYHIPIVEDAAEALGSFFEKQHAGTLGEVGVLSFNGNKIITTGSGGAVITNNEKIAEKIRHRANQAKTDLHDYFHDEVGYNYRMANILAAIGVAQMEQLATFLEKKKLIDQIYRENLEKMAILQAVEPQVSPNFWLFTALLENSEQIATKLSQQGIQVRKLWYPLSRLPMNQDSLYIQQEDITWQVYAKSLSLPSGVGLQAEGVLRICEIITHWAKK
jgi:aminotransferase in exopolysaccharide biosynthesis